MNQSGEISGAMKTKDPQLLEALCELDKAVDVLRNSTMMIYEELRIAPIPSLKKEPETAPSTNARISERIDTIFVLREKVYTINSRLEEILAAVREI